MPIAGIDWAWAAPGRPSEKALDDAGVVFVARYLSGADRSKCITRAETARHLAAGRAIVLVYEDDAASVLGGHTAGARHAATAAAQARAAGLDGAVIYFACDYDAPEHDQPAIHAYLDGAASILGRSRVGLYGGYWPLSRARAARKAAYLWGTRAWSGGMWDTCGWKPHIMQGIQTSIGGVSADWDAAHAADYGQWPRPGSEHMHPTLTPGDAGAAVTDLQQRLNEWRAVPQLTPDGQYGPATTAAVNAFQHARGLVVDGICGPATWAALDQDPPGGPWHGEYITAGQLSLAGLSAKLGYPPSALLRMTAVRYGTLGDGLAAWVNDVTAGNQPPDTPLPEGTRFWCG